MKIQGQFAERMAGLGLATLVRGWMSTLDLQILHRDPLLDPAHPQHDQNAIFVLWHEYIPLPLYLRPHSDMVALISGHRDGQLMARVAGHMGIQVVHGSSFRGGRRALRELLRVCRGRNVVITPDGPRGPRRVMAPGPIYLASRLGLPIVPAGFGYNRPWRMKSWDRFAVPRPFSRGRMILGHANHIPRHDDRQQLEAHRQVIETQLNQLTHEAEQWAANGARHRGELPARAEIMPRHVHRLPGVLSTRPPSLEAHPLGNGRQTPQRAA